MTAPLAGEELLAALESGAVRVAEPARDGTWIVHAWVKEEILKLFRASPVVPLGGVAPASALPYGTRGSGVAGSLDRPARHAFLDKAAFPLRTFALEDDVRIVPGGSAIRRGAHLGPGVVCMPPMYVNVGAHVGAGTMIDSHALVGSCAQIGAGVHLSAAAQIGGVLEPPAARPVIVEDQAFIGGNVGIYEGVRIGRGAVVAAGVVLTASTPVFDVVRQRELRGSAAEPLSIPADAVVVPGSRPLDAAWARERDLHVACALIVKYRDEATDARTALESALRPFPDEGAR